MDTMISKIKAMALTRTDAAIAEYILDNIDTVGLLTSTSLADNIGVSDTSIIRFIRKLGFKGYTDFRNEMVDRIAKQHYQSQQESSLLTGEKYALTKGRLKKESIIHDVSVQTLDNLEKSFSKLDNYTVDQVADILIKSNHKFIAGFRGTASCAQYMASRLLLLLPNVSTMLHADSTAIERIVDIKEDDCLFLYSFRKYSEICYNLINIARSNGAKIILMTDSYTSPLASKADIVLVSKVAGLGFTNSYIAPMSISEIILLTISNRSDSNCDERLKMMDKIILDGKFY